MFPAPQPNMQRATQMGRSSGQGAQFPLATMGAASGQQQAQQQAPDPQQMLAMASQKVMELEKTAESLMQLLAVMDPEAQALLVPIAQGGSALKARLEQAAQRMQQGPGTPDAAQAAGGGSPAPNPDEGATPTAMAA